jgi:hypothetical protein
LEWRRWDSNPQPPACKAGLCTPSEQDIYLNRKGESAQIHPCQVPSYSVNFDFSSEMVAVRGKSDTRWAMPEAPTPQVVYISAKDIALRWSCTTETVFARLGAAGVAEYCFGPRTVRWKLEDIEAYELSRTRTPRHIVKSAVACDGVKAKSRRNFKAMLNG